jgi:hypothetical protein
MNEGRRRKPVLPFFIAQQAQVGPAFFFLRSRRRKPVMGTSNNPLPVCHPSEGMDPVASSRRRVTAMAFATLTPSGPLFERSARFALVLPSQE